MLTGLSPGAAARAVGASRATGYRWWARDQAERWAGLQERPATPKRQPRRLSPRWKRRSWRRASAVGPARSPAGRGWGARPRRWGRCGGGGGPRAARGPRGRPSCATNAPSRASGSTWTPGSWAAAGTSASASGRTASTAVPARAGRLCRSPSTTTPGWLTPRCGPRTRGATPSPSWTALAWFRAQGIPVQAVMPDNGSTYRSTAWCRNCAARGLRHLHTRPYPPRTNGKAQRCIHIRLRTWPMRSPIQPAPTARGRSSAGSGGIPDGVPTARWAASHPSAVSPTSVVSPARRRRGGAAAIRPRGP